MKKTKYKHQDLFISLVLGIIISLFTLFISHNRTIVCDTGMLTVMITAEGQSRGFPLNMLNQNCKSSGNVPKNIETNINFPALASNIIIWSTISFFLAYIYKKTKND